MGDWESESIPTPGSNSFITFNYIPLNFLEMLSNPYNQFFLLFSEANLRFLLPLMKKLVAFKKNWGMIYIFTNS